METPEQPGQAGATAKNKKDLSVLRIEPEQREAPERGPRKGRGLLFIIAGVIAAVIVAGIIGVRTFASAPVVNVARVAVSSAPSAGTPVLTASGYIVAHHTIQVSSKIVGKVIWVGIEAGDKVTKGQVLARLDDSEFRAQYEQAVANFQASQAKLKELEAGSRPQEIAASKATVAQAEATFKNAAINLKRQQALFSQQIASQQQLTDAQSQYQVALAQLNNARQNYTLVKIGPRIEDINAQQAQAAQTRAAEDYAQTMLDACLIRSPIDGTVLERDVEIGEMVSNQNFGGNTGVKSSVATLANLNDLLVELDINETDFPKISPHQLANVTADAYPSRVYKGYVYEIAPQADRQKATIQIKVKIDKPDSFLRPEMNAHVTFLAPQMAGAEQTTADSLTVPASAIIQRNGQTAVFVLAGEHVKLTTVQTGSQTGGQTEVVSGLGPNDVVVVSGQSELKTGERVKVSGGA
ncbi:MAG: efflux RND transporter periplasmic adaptor subunit [Acidobacteriota bacterium]|nr:efflux RND transporter periplasmic adaptor subunit [Acidobacteriota bacterium]